MIRRWSRNGLWLCLWLGLIGLLLWCLPSLVGAPEVEYSGCWAVYTPGPICALYPSRDDQDGKTILKLWVKTRTGAHVEVWADDHVPVATLNEELEGGRRYELQLPTTTSRLIVRFARSDGVRSPSWTLPLSGPEKPDWMEKVNKLAYEGKTEEARERLALLRRNSPSGEQGLVLRMSALLARQSNEFDQAIAYLQEGIEADGAHRRLSGVVEKTAQLTGLYLEQGRFRDAQQLLSSLRLPPGAPADAKNNILYYQGSLANRIGDYRSALEYWQQAADLARRVGMRKFLWKTEQMQAGLYQQLGRAQDAVSLFARLDRDRYTETPCDLGDLWTNWAWSQLLAREAGGEAPDPTPLLRKAKAQFDTGLCSKNQQLNARLNLALAHWQNGRWRDARVMLDQAREIKAEPTLRERLWWDDLEARLEIEEGRPLEALRLYDMLDQRAQSALSLEGRVRAALGRARALREMARSDEALAALEAVGGFIDDQLLQIPMQEGRDTFLAQQEAATRLHVEILLGEGHSREALHLVRKDRSRLFQPLTIRHRLPQVPGADQSFLERELLKYLEVRDEIDRQAAEDWKLSGDELERAQENRRAQLARALKVLDEALARLGGNASLREHARGHLAQPRPGEVILTYYPLSSGWVGFVAYGNEVQVTGPLELPPTLDDSAALASTLLEPFHAVIQGAERVRMLPYGRLREVDFHVLPFDGKPLLAGRPVVYGVDVPVRSSTPAGPSPRRALLIADPTGELPAARQEAEEISAVITSWGRDWTLDKLETTEALADRVRRILPRAELFHFAGHGTFDGFGAWESRLVLADESSLTLGDLLTLRRVPAWVVLSSCVAGRSSLEAPGEGLGLAHAFILAGARGVIASTRPVPDPTSRELMRELYRHWRPGLDLAVALQRAQLKCLESDPDCASFRLLEP